MRNAVTERGQPLFGLSDVKRRHPDLDGCGERDTRPAPAARAAGRTRRIWISHLHADHSADLFTAYYGALYADIRLAAPIPLYGPPGIADRLAGSLTNTPACSPIESAFVITELHEGHQATIGSLLLTSRAVAHDMLCEAESAQAPTEGDRVHHTPEDAGDTARMARAGRLIVTHVDRFLTPQQAVARASTRFDGPVDYAAPGATFTTDQETTASVCSRS